MVRLVRPDERYEASYLDMVGELVGEGRRDEGAVFDHPSFGAFVRHLEQLERGVGLPEGYVAGSARWLVEGDDVVGRVDLRHELNNALRRYGGHVGYIVRPSRRRDGLGTHALALALPQCAALGLERVLVTCDLDNEGSRRIIEANSGVLEDVIKVPGRASPTMRWWIDVTPVGHASDRTALLVEIGAADDVVAPWRYRFDRMARAGVPAHVTVLYPFRTVVDEAARDRVSRIASSIGPTFVEFREPATFPGVVWLRPEPDAVFRALTQAVTVEFPDTPPYGGAHPDPTPHLSVAKGLDPAAERRLLEALRVALRREPIAAAVDALALYASDQHGRWTRQARWPLTG